MVTSFAVKLFMLIEVLMSGARLGVDALSMNYYALSCPLVEPVVTDVVNDALRQDPTLAAGLLRMHFHDCFIQGCDGSVLIDSTKDNTAEKDSPANLSLRGYEIIDQAKQMIEDQCPGVVSCADILALAARDAVFFSGGPFYDIPKGRKDGRRSKIEDTINLPAPTLNTTALIKMFGAHTLGAARCSSFKHRLSHFDSTHDVDPNLDSNFAAMMSRTCSQGDNTAMPLDQTRNSFDNAYFNALQRRMGLLFSDQSLFADPRTRRIVDAFAMNQAMFFFNFQQAIVKMGLLDVKEGDEGEIRLDCRNVN